MPAAAPEPQSGPLGRPDRLGAQRNLDGRCRTGPAARRLRRQADVIDATSGAGGLPSTSTTSTPITFAPQKNFASDGGTLDRDHEPGRPGARRRASRPPAVGSPSSCRCRSRSTTAPRTRPQHPGDRHAGADGRAAGLAPAVTAGWTGPSAHRRFVVAAVLLGRGRIVHDAVRGRPGVALPRWSARSNRDG